MFSALACGATAASAAPQGGDILVIASSTDSLTLANGRSVPVGFFLNEFAVPAQYLAKKGYRLVLATPSGKFPVMDQSPNSAAFFSGSEEARAEALRWPLCPRPPNTAAISCRAISQPPSNPRATGSRATG